MKRGMVTEVFGQIVIECTTRRNYKTKFRKGISNLEFDGIIIRTPLFLRVFNTE